MAVNSLKHKYAQTNIALIKEDSTWRVGRTIVTHMRLADRTGRVFVDPLNGITYTARNGKFKITDVISRKSLDGAKGIKLLKDYVLPVVDMIRQGREVVYSDEIKRTLRK